MKTIYLLWSGCYSEAWVVGAFTTREKAEGYMKQHESALDHPRVEDGRLDPEPFIPKGGKWFCVEFRNGTLEAMSVEEGGPWGLEREACSSSDIEGWMYYVGAVDEQHAVKIASEKQARYLAEKQP